MEKLNILSSICGLKHRSIPAYYHKNKGGDTLVWHPAHEPYPHPKKGGDVQLLLKVQNLPMPYLAATWDGNNLDTFSTFGYPTSPWSTFPESIKIEAWAVLP